MAEPTPGPWRIAKGQMEADDSIMAGRFYICYMAGSLANPEIRADARLIAAAPDMRDALADLIVRFERCCKAGGSDEEFIKLATAKHRAALAKARGEEHGDVGASGAAGREGEPA